MANKEIRTAITAAGVRYWQIADVLQVHENTLYRLLRHELTGEKRQRVLAAIAHAKATKEGE